jgi:hypothetical protein
MRAYAGTPQCVIGKLCGSGGDVVAERAKAVFSVRNIFRMMRGINRKSRKYVDRSLIEK